MTSRLFSLPLGEYLRLVAIHKSARKIRLRLRVAYESTTTYDDRVEFTELDLKTIIDHVRTRIFVKGHNANDEQMQPAKSYKPPRGLYRYLTGRLYRSIRVRILKQGVMQLSWDYPGIILGALEARYGPIFEWSPSDEVFVDKMASGILREMQLPDAGQGEAVARGRAAVREVERAEKERQKEAAKKVADEARGRKRDAKEKTDEANRAADEEDELGQRVEEQARARKTPTPEERAAGRVLPPVSRERVLRSSRFYRLTPTDINELVRMIRSRILSGQTATGVRIPESLRKLINRETIDSIDVYQRAGAMREINLGYTLRNPALLNDARIDGVFAWSNAEIRAVKKLIDDSYKKAGDVASAAVVTRL